MQTIAIAVRDNELFLEATVVRTVAGDVYVNVVRDHDPVWKPHISYHASGQHHHKSYGVAPTPPQRKQKPDTKFKGTANVDSFGLASGEYKLFVQPCDPSNYSAVFEIPACLLRPEKYRTYVYTDLVEPGMAPMLYPDASILKQETYRDAEPWIVLTFLCITFALN